MNESSETVNPSAELLKLNPKEHKRFWSKVEKTESCWIWCGARHTHGYGSLGFRTKPARAHRMSYEIHKGPIPKGFCVLHKCDIPSCVNPNHLFLGTHTDNMQDRIKKGRANLPSGDNHNLRIHPELIKRGENHPMVRLSEVKVLKIRALYATGALTLKNIAAIYSVNYTTIGYIVNRITWNHI